VKSKFPLVFLALLVLAGCGKEQPEATAPANPATEAASSESPAAPASAVTLETLDAVGAAKKPFKIVLIVKTRNNPFFKPMIESFEATVKKLGATPEVQAPPQEMDKEKQFALVQDEIGKKVDAICIAPADSAAIVPALLEAQKKGIVVINLDNRVDAKAASEQGLHLSGYVGADNEAGGVKAGEAMVEALKGSGSVAVVGGLAGAENAEARKRGFMAAVKGKLNVVDTEIADWDTEKAYQKTQSMLAAHPGIQGVFCANDKMAVGAMKAISESGKTGKVAVVGYDNIPDVQPALKSGALYATIEQHPDRMGEYGAKMAVGLLNETVPAGGEILVPLETMKGGKGKAP
jgi:ribose transport system substrate-binding protein